jgi:anti-sigma regulatory factor (Ser/Thr protein kinase)
MISKNILSKDFIARMTVFSDSLYIRAAQEFVLYYAKLFRFSELDLHKIELITEEAVVNVIENSFEKDEYGSFDIKVSYKPGAFIITIEDQGIPSSAELLEKKETSALGLLLMRNLTDEFNLINLGRGGKKTELIKYLPETSIEELLTREEKEQNLAAETAVSSDVPTMRLVRPDDAPMLSRLAYRVYGYTYSSAFYYPEKIKELIETGLLTSVVSVNKEQEIVGNLSLFFEHKGAPVADSGAAMVDPRYRGHSLFKISKRFLSDYATENNMYGIYSEAVTIHSFTQQGNISLGAKETGIMLAFAGENLTFKKINNDKKSEQRQAVVLYYLKTNQEPQRTVHLSEKFCPILSKVYTNLALDREIIMIKDDENPEANHATSIINTAVKPDLNIAVISILQMGNDAVGMITRQLRELCLKKIETIYVEIPMDIPFAAVVSRELNKSGFMLSGIVPELRNGDILKMQYLNNVYVDPAKIVIASPLATALLTEIMKDYQ